MKQLLVGDVLWNAAARTPRRVAATLEGRSVTYTEPPTRCQLATTALACGPTSVASRPVGQRRMEATNVASRSRPIAAPASRLQASARSSGDGSRIVPTAVNS